MTDKEQEAVEQLRSLDLFGNLMLRWDFENNVFTDYMGMPVSRTMVVALRKMIRDHLKKSPADLAHLGNQVYQQQMPRMQKDSPLLPESFE